MNNENAPGQNKEFELSVNSRVKLWNKKTISYEEVIILAFGSVSSDPNVSYTVPSWVSNCLRKS